METKELAKVRPGWPSLFDKSWIDKFMNVPVDEFFNLPKMMNVPAVNIQENEKEFLIEVGAPGLKKEDFKIEIENDLMSISAEVKKEEVEDKPGKYNRKEYNFTSWNRTFTIPENGDLDNIKAEYLNGELKIRMPKKIVEPVKNPKFININ
jgi:HSP20 family protein